MNRYQYVDALRGVAILSVLVVHCGQYGSGEFMPGLFKSITELGARGVQLFFIVSAFTLFLSSKKRVLTEENPTTNFFIRRFFRIAPMYYLGIIYHWIVTYIYDPTHALITPGAIISNFTFTHGFSPYWINSVVPGGWSIAVEMSFYLLIPTILFKVVNSLRNAVIFYGVSTIFVIALKYILLLYPLIDNEKLWGGFLFEFLPNQLPIFALGFIFYFLTTDNSTRIRLHYKIILSILLASSFIFVIFKFIFPIDIYETHFVMGPVFLLFSYLISRENYSIIVNDFIAYIGKISYSMYLVHFVVLYWMGKLGWADFIAVNGATDAILNYVIRYAVLLFISTIVSEFFFRAIEVPFQNIGKSIINNLKVKRVYAE
jgi:peptidoglycan/LPS O-acetylase OafA/YrhL